MRSHGLTARRAPVRAVLRAVLCAGLAIATLGCGEAAAPTPAPAALVDEAPPAIARPVNINEQLVATTLGAAGLVAPYRVIGIRLGTLGDLKGVAMADRAAVAAWQGTGRTTLDSTAWRVELVATQPVAACPDGACAARAVHVEAYLSQQGRWVIAIAMQPLAPGDPLIPSAGG